MKTRQPIASSRIGRRKFLKMGAAAVASYGVAAPAIAQQRVRSMRFGHMLPPETVYHKAILMFAEEVNKNSGSKMKIDVYPSSQLGSIPEMLSQLKVGSLTMSMAVPAWYSNFMKPIDAFTLPYIVSSSDRLKTALDGNIGKEINRMGQGAGFYVFGYWLLGGRHIVNKVRPINVPADCQGPEASRHQ
jgi:TRAP-type C4-dicarboxylate transport system substrate-binding protein